MIEVLFGLIKANNGKDLTIIGIFQVWGSTKDKILHKGQHLMNYHTQKGKVS
jgi:hypothetical protein